MLSTHIKVTEYFSFLNINQFILQAKRKTRISPGLSILFYLSLSTKLKFIKQFI